MLAEFNAGQDTYFCSQDKVSITEQRLLAFINIGSNYDYPFMNSNSVLIYAKCQ